MSGVGSDLFSHRGIRDTGPQLGVFCVVAHCISFRKMLPRFSTQVQFGPHAAGMIVTQWLASAVGGYLSGRLRKKWVGIRTDEVFFRDTAHGFLGWALATVLMAALFSFLASTVAVTGDVTVATPTAEAQKVAASYSLFTALSFLIGAFVASVAAAWAGWDRDDI
jgi:hypothetical protein